MVEITTALALAKDIQRIADGKWMSTDQMHRLSLACRDWAEATDPEQFLGLQHQFEIARQNHRSESTRQTRRDLRMAASALEKALRQAA